MGFYDVLEEAADNAGMSLAAVGLAIGKNRNYVSGGRVRGSEPSTANAAAMLGACGWSLVAVPTGDVPPSALVIEPPDADPDDAERRALERKRDRLRRELAATDALLG